jgi:hypothetical protein
VIGAGERDAVLGVHEVAVGFAKTVCALNCRILFRDGEERRGGWWPSAGRPRSARAKRGDQRWRRGLVGAESLHAGDQRRDQVGAALELARR